MAAGDKLLLESGAGDFLDLDSSSADDLLLEEAGAGGGFQVAWAVNATVTIASGTPTQ